MLFYFCCMSALALQLIYHSTASTTQQQVECSGCEDSNVTDEEQRNVRLEYIKAQILKKLRLDAPPNVTKSFIPEQLSKELLSDLTGDNEDENEDIFSREDFYGKTHEVVIFPDNSSTFDCQAEKPTTSCFQFQITPEVTFQSVTSAELWVHEEITDSNVSLAYTVRDALEEQENSTSKKLVAEAILPRCRSSEWTKLDITSVLLSWVESGQLLKVLEIGCDGCEPPTKEGQEPFLMIRSDPRQLNHTRRRRNLTCSPNTTLCCKQKFHVSFHDIGWHRWIIKPESYDANFCRGSCLPDISSARYFHTTVLRGYIQSHSATGRNVTLSLCCTPYRMTSLTIMYMTEKRHIYKKTLPNMIAQSCDCA